MTLTKFWNKKVKKLNFWDLQFIKASVFFFAFWVISFISVEKIIKYRWLWFGLFLIFAIKPFYKAYVK